MTMMVKKKKKRQIIWPNLECVVFLIPPKNPKGAYPKTLKVHASFITILVYASITSLKNEVPSVIHNSSSLSFAAATGSPSAWQTYLLNSAAMGWLSRHPTAQESANTLNSTASPTAPRSIQIARHQCHQVCFITSEVLKKVERVLFKSNHSDQPNSWICEVSAGPHSDTKSAPPVACRTGVLIPGSTKRCCWWLLFYQSVLQRHSGSTPNGCWTQQTYIQRRVVYSPSETVYKGKLIK